MRIAIVLNGCSTLLNKQIEELNSFIYRFLDKKDEIEAWILVDREISIKEDNQKKNKSIEEGIKLIDRINSVKFIRTQKSYLAEAYLDSIEKTYEMNKPDLLIFGSGQFGCEMSVRLSYRLQGSSCIGVKNLNIEEDRVLVEKLVYSNNLTAKLLMKKRPYCISIAKGFKDKIEVLDKLPRFIELDYNANISYPWIKACKVKLNEKEEGLTSSDIVIAVGRGIGNKENIKQIEELAEMIGGEVGASRPVVMSAWTDMNKLIGASGSIISPEILIVIGVSGAAAFQIGIEKSKWIVAINKDDRAPILKGADVAVIGEYREVVEEIVKMHNAR
ncbi:electron transfer flavoprotein subunit alpha/FixB family protein [Clostridium sp. DL1XJH146]